VSGWDLFWEKRMAEDAMEVAMEVDEASTSHKADSSSEGQREDVWYFPTAAHRWSLVEKYRPTSLADVAAHTDIIDTSMYAYLFVPHTWSSLYRNFVFL